MKAVVVYESLWGNTAAVARAVAEGIGPETPALSTAEATEEALADVDLLVAGAPVIVYGLSSERKRAGIRTDSLSTPPPDLSHPPMKSWLGDLSGSHAAAAAFETRLWWSPRGAAPTILRALKRAGYHPVSKAKRFVVAGTRGPLRQGELPRARSWGEELARRV